MLQRKGVGPRELRLIESRYAWQQSGDAVQLLAWNGMDLVGRATFLWRSKYPSVRTFEGKIGSPADVVGRSEPMT